MIEMATRWINNNFNKEKQSKSEIKEVADQIDGILEAYRIPGYSENSLGRTLNLGQSVVRRVQHMERDHHGIHKHIKFEYFVDQINSNDPRFSLGIKIDQKQIWSYERRSDQTHEELTNLSPASLDYAKELLEKIPQRPGDIRPRQ